MRTLMIVKMSVEKGNMMIKSGKLETTMKSMMEELKPEAAYFSVQCGMRTGYIIFDLKDVSDIPKIAEPWFLAFDAEVSMRPVMTPQDLAKAGPAIAQAVKMYG